MLLADGYRQPYTEASVLFTKDDVELNLDRWTTEENHNILYVVGLSGSGKTTLAERYEKKYRNTYMFEMDGICMNYDASNQGVLKELYQTSRAYKKLRDTMDREEQIPKDEFDKLHRQSCRDAIKVMSKRKGKRFIVEGIQIYEFFKPQELINKPIIFKNTSMVQSIYQRFKRNADGGQIRWGDELKHDFIGLLRWYAEENSLLNDFYKKFKKYMKEEE